MRGRKVSTGCSQPARSPRKVRRRTGPARVVSCVVGPKMITWRTRMKIGQSVRDDGPQTHLTKAGTPTMGGALILVSICVTTLLWGDLSNRFVWAVLLVTVGFGAV